MVKTYLTSVYSNIDTYRQYCLLCVSTCTFSNKIVKKECVNVVSIYRGNEIMTLSMYVCTILILCNNIVYIIELIYIIFI